MATSDDVPDSTDWLSTPLSGFAAVEAALRCQVCKDFYKTPMITSCSHTFCSICIRRALSNDGKCPMCRATEQELKLRSNWSMEETVEAFSKARIAALNLARNQGSRSQSPKRKANEVSPDAHATHEPKRLRTSARLNKNRGEPTPITAPVQATEEQVVPDSNNDDDDGDDCEYVPDAPNGLVPCPLCNKKMKEWQVFGHLESCPGPSAASNSSDTVDTDGAFSFGQSQRRQQKTLERLPPLNYSMLKEQALRKKMSELGISNQGPRILLEKRHKEWLTLWNANCDAALPKKRSELLHDLDVWERTQGGRAPTTGRVVQTAAVIKDKDFDGAAWAAKHDNSFKDLIANARKSRQEAKKKAEVADKATGDQSQSSTSQPPELMVISSSQPPGGTTTDENPTIQQGEETTDNTPGLQSLPFAHTEPMSWEASQRPIDSALTTEAPEIRRAVEADKY
ncbi:e3 ubiquitin- ligase rad18 [Trichoderma arundinaceum]|uniref:Postreplication repair E3 ubiquitin-protein ligase RAD18 n=1 Tax=Trichoderma arundinaceum TaxID=490622 RepID=A0A395NDN5_TRIAR|nr:e3 ubiquitin- ligase rad18 [Trichoderma arundinaceum]